MSHADRIAAWIAEADADELRKLVQFLDDTSMEASVLILQYTADPAGTPARYEEWKS